MTAYICLYDCLYGQDSKSKKQYQNGCHLKTTKKVRIIKYLMCIDGGHMCICIPNMKFLCLTMCQGEVCTDDDDADTDAG